MNNPSLIVSYFTKVTDFHFSVHSAIDPTSNEVSISHKLVNIECSRYLAQISSCQAAPKRRQTVAIICHNFFNWMISRCISSTG